MIRFRLALFLGVAIIPVALQRAAAQPPAGRPNIIVILADDMGFSDLGCYGSEITTPNLDRLAAHGLRFTQFYNTARCCPTRASLLTGLYSHQAGVGHMIQDLRAPAYRGDLNRRCVTIAEVLRPAGYHTLMTGKWHVTSDLKDSHNWPLQRGFEKFFGLISSVRSYYDPPTLTEGDTPIKAGKDFYLTDALTDHAVDYVREFAARKEPFFLYVAYTAPHWPLHALPADIARYRGKYRVGWDELRKQRHQRQIAMGLVDKRWPLTPRDELAPAWDKAEHRDWQDMRMAVYSAQIECLDRGVGRIVKQLEESGQKENTLILFLSDNGGCAEEIPASWRGRMFPELTRDGKPTRVGNDPAVLPGPADVFQSYGLPWANASNTPFRLYKHWVHEGGIATPLIVHWPSVVKQPGITHQPGHVIDLMATCLDAANATYPKKYQGNDILPVEGTSLLPILQGKTREVPDLFWEHEGNRAVRSGNWKLVARAGGVWELYDLAADRTELHNVVSEQAEKAKELTTKYERWAERVGVLPWQKVQPKEGN
jgi:arylsulfatase